MPKYRTTRQYTEADLRYIQQAMRLDLGAIEIHINTRLILGQTWEITCTCRAPDEQGKYQFWKDVRMCDPKRLDLLTAQYQALIGLYQGIDVSQGRHGVVLGT